MLILAVFSTALPAQNQAGKIQTNVDLYFFWSESCPHCQQARPLVQRLSEQHPWLRLHSREVSKNLDNALFYEKKAAELGETARSVPAFIFCDQMIVGFDHAEGIGRQLQQALMDCRHGKGPSHQQYQLLPVDIDPDQMSLPLFTLTIAALDAFNPCAFFVLLFLLSLMVNAKSRLRMALIGGTFVFFSGLIYFLFMAAWLELFLLVGALGWVTLIAGLVALIIGAINIKDYFRFKQGPSLSISDSAKPALFIRMRNLLSADNFSTMMIGTITMAIAANSYELLCTAGFPMVYTRVLTMQADSQTGYYFYLLFYNLVYITPLLLIVLVFTLTMGRRKLSEGEGRTLKLLSGIMMASLGSLLLLAPELLNQLLTGVVLLMAALVIAFTIKHFSANS